MLIGVTVMMMVMIVFMRQGRRQRRTGCQLRDGPLGIRLAGRMNADAMTRHALHEPRPCALGDQGIEPQLKQWVIFSVIIMDGHPGRQVKSFRLDRGRGSIHVVDDEATALAGMPGDGLEILTGDCNAHDGGLLVVRCQIETPHELKSGGRIGLVQHPDIDAIVL